MILSLINSSLTYSGKATIASTFAGCDNICSTTVTIEDLLTVDITVIVLTGSVAGTTVYLRTHQAHQTN